MSVSNDSARIIELPRTAVSRRVDTVRRVRAQVEKKTRYLMEGLAANAADALFEEMHHLDEQAARASHFNVMRALKVGSAPLTAALSQQLGKGWIDLVHRRESRPEHALPVDLEPVVAAWAARSRSHYKIIQEELRLRFSCLSRRNVARHPLLPETFYQGFWLATETLDLTIEERELMVMLFHRFVMDRFGQVLAIANNTLVHLNVPARFD